MMPLVVPLLDEFFTWLRFSPDGRHLLVSGNDGPVMIFTLDHDALVSIAQRRLTRTLTAAECQTYLHRAFADADA